MNWAEIIQHPSLRDLPFKIETNAQGQIIMSPAKGYHGHQQANIIILLDQLLNGGMSFVECPVETKEGVKVADVAWYAEGRLDEYLDETTYPLAGDICVEVDSPSNTNEEMEHKRVLYASRGAKEFWICQTNGQMHFYDAPTGEKFKSSRLCPSFPQILPRRRKRPNEGTEARD